MPNDPRNALAQLLEMMGLHDRPVVIEPPAVPIQDPLSPRKGGMKDMSHEGQDLMALLNHYLGAQVGPEDLHDDTKEILNRIPEGRTIGDQGEEDAETL